MCLTNEAFKILGKPKRPILFHRRDDDTWKIRQGKSYVILPYSYQFDFAKNLNRNRL